MRLHFISLLAIGLCPFTAGFAQTKSGASLGPSSIGTVFDRELRALRRVTGIPGAALLGGAMDIGIPIANIGIARDLILVSSAIDGSLHLVLVGHNSVSVRSIDDVIVGPDRIAPSSLGRAAVLSSGGSLQIISGLPSAPVSSPQFSIAQAGEIAAAAVSDDGRFALCIAGGNRGSGVWRLNVEEGKFENVLQAATAAITFRPNSGDAVAVAVSGDIYYLPESGDIRKLGLVVPNATPIGVQSDTNATRVYVAYSDGTVAVIDASGSASTLSCQCTPTGLDVMIPAGLFRLNDPSDGTLILLDATGVGARTWFVPPDRVLENRPENNL